MSRRNVTTSELAHKFSMHGNTVKQVLKKSRVKPVSVTTSPAGREYAEWPNRAANAALREFRANVPVHGHVKTGFKKTGKVSAKLGAVVNIDVKRRAKQYDQLMTEMVELKKQLTALTAGMRAIAATISPNVKAA